MEVGSGGLGQPFRVHRQWEIHLGQSVETQLKDGRKYRGILASVDDEGFVMNVMEKVKEEGRKRPVSREVEHRFLFGEVAYTKYLINKIK